MPANFSIPKRQSDLVLLTAGADVAVPVSAVFRAPRSPKAKLLSNYGLTCLLGVGSLVVVCISAALRFA